MHISCFYELFSFRFKSNLKKPNLISYQLVNLYYPCDLQIFLTAKARFSIGAHIPHPHPLILLRLNCATIIKASLNL
jgi:hypothetical protein